MGVERFFNKTVTQKRKASRTGDAVEVWNDINTAVKCCIYPLNPGDVVAFQSAYNRLNITHKMNCLLNVGTVTLTFVPGDVDTGVDEKITVSLDIATGQEIRFTTTGVLPAPLVAGTVYYAINVDATHIQVATTLTLALVPTAVNLTTQGTLVHTLIVIEDIKIGDKIVYGNDEYIVKRVQSWDKIGMSQSFYEVYLSEVA